MAKRDLAEIWAFIALDSETRADTFIDSLLEPVNPLLDYPMAGAPRDIYASGLRAVFHKDYVVYYTHTVEEVVIIRVAHGARDQAALFNDP